MLRVKSKRYNDLVEGTIILSLAAISVKLVGVLYKVPLSYILSDEGMGYFNSAYTVYGFFYTVCSAGLPKAITIFFTKLSEECNKEDCAATLRVLFKKFLLLGLLVSGVYYLLSFPICNIIGSKKMLPTVLSVGPSIVFVILGGIAKGYLSAIGAMGDIALSQLTEAASKLVLGLYFAKLGDRFGLPVYLISALSVLGITIGAVLSALYLIIRCKIKNKGNRTRQNVLTVGSRALKTVLSTAAPITVGAALLSFGSMLDLGIVIRRLSDIGYDEASATALYGNFTTLAVPMLNLVVSVTGSVCIPLLPYLSKAALRDDRPGFEKSLREVITITALLSSMAAAAFAYFSFEILDILFPAYSSVVGSRLLCALSPAVFLLPLLTVVNTALEAKGRVRASVVSLLLGCLLKLVIEFILIGNPRVGVLGASVSTAVGYGFSLVLSIIFLKLDSKAVLVSIATLLLAYLSYGVAYFTVYYSNMLNNSFLSLILAIIFGSFIYLLSFLLLSRFLLISKKTAKKQVNIYK